LRRILAHRQVLRKHADVLGLELTGQVRLDVNSLLDVFELVDGLDNGILQVLDDLQTLGLAQFHILLEDRLEVSFESVFEVG